MNKLSGGVYFVSNDHTRYESGQKIEGDSQGALRGIKIFREPDDNKIYEVSIHILDESLSNWGDKIQMSPKLMKVLNESENEIVLRGIHDDFDNSFADYGIDLHYENHELTNVTLKLLDRNVDIIYNKIAKNISHSSQKINIAIELLNQLIDNHDDGDSLVRESDLKERLKTKYSLNPATSEIMEAVNFINSNSNRKVISEGWIPIGGILSSTQESSYITEAPINFLNELIGLMK